MTAPGSDLESHAVGADAPVLAPTEDSKQVVKSPGRLAMERFRRDKLSMVSLGVVVFYFLAALAAPILVKTGVLDPTTFHQDLLIDSSDNPFRAGLPEGRFGGISGDHWLGVDPKSGRDVLSRIWYGTTFSLGMALAATIIAVVVGTVLGIVSGAAGGWVDAIIGRITDLTLAFPQTLMLLALSGVGILWITKAGVPDGDAARATYVILVLGAFGWTGVCRLVRGQVLSIREREFVHAATLLGASRFRIYFKEILPNLWAPILVTFTLIMPAFVSAEAALSYLGVSIVPPTPTLGNILRDSLNYAQFDFVFFFAPAFLIALIVICFNLLGDGLRDALDPKGDR